MGLRKVLTVILATLVVAGFGVCAGAQSSGAKKTTSKSSEVSATSGSKTRKTSSKKGRKKKERGQQAPTADRISEIQTALSKEGSYSGTPSGKWDDATIAAIRNFQSAHGLNPSGKLDAPTLTKLGLGSQTAGVAAPIVPPNATSRLLSSNRELATRQ
jgi:peptidoglycan hydrolase-like protein with peptidoglycan-binding domain